MDHRCRHRDRRVSDEDKARILQSDDVGELIVIVAEQPAHVTLNETLITNTYNRFAVERRSGVCST